MGGMEKTTVYLTTAQRAALRRAATAEQRSEATLIRAGIDAVIARHRTGEAPTPGSVADALPMPPGRPRWVDRESFVRDVLRSQADPGLADELRQLSPDTTDDLPLR